MNIALFGGSFDPPHIAHEMIVEQVLNTIKDIDKLIVMPTYLNPFKKQSHLTPTQRYNLVLDIFKHNPKVEISNFEVNASKPVASIETVLHLKSIYNPDKIYLVIGADNLNTLHKWQNFNKLSKLVTFIVVTRTKYEVKDDIIDFIQINMDIDISSTKIREKKDISYIPKKIKTKVKDIWNNE